MAWILSILDTEDYWGEMINFRMRRQYAHAGVHSVMHIFNGLNPSGMEKMLLSAAQHSPLPRRNVFIVGQGSKNPFSGQLRDAGYNVVILPGLFTFRGLWALFSLIRETRPSVIHVHSESCYPQAVIISRLAAGRVGIVRTVHSIFDKKRLPTAYRRFTAAICDSYVDKFVACSPEVQAFERQFGRTTDLVWNWVDDRFFSERERPVAAPKSSSQVLLVGNCSVIKNHVVVLEALELLTRDNIELELSHFGIEDGANPAEMGLLDGLDEAGRLLHRGPGDPIERMTDRPTYLMPSLHEGMGVALAEAIVVGLPALVADVPGLQWAREFSNVRHVANNVESWKKELFSTAEGISTSPTLNIDRFRAENGIKAYHKVYESALDASSGRGITRFHQK